MGWYSHKDGRTMLYLKKSSNYYLYEILFHQLLLQLPRISSEDGILDLVVIGCGPAGLALAAESSKLGLSVGLVGPDLPFTNNYGVWEDEFKGINLISVRKPAYKFLLLLSIFMLVWNPTYLSWLI